jgi:hypothetical protein
MLPSLLCLCHLLSFVRAPTFSKNPGVPDEPFIMPRVTLSTGVTFPTECIRYAEYYPSRSRLNEGVVNCISAQREKDFLFIRTIRGSAHVRGNGAAQDAIALEEAGVRVERRPIPAALPSTRSSRCASRRPPTNLNSSKENTFMKTKQAMATEGTT